MASRSERRRQEREDRRRRTITVPDGKLLRADVLTPLGRVEEVTNWRKLPAKQPGVHRWVCAISHYMTPEQADIWNNRSEGVPVLLDSTSIMFAGLGCIDCEGEYAEVVASPCPAGDDWPSDG